MSTPAPAPSAYTGRLPRGALTSQAPGAGAAAGAIRRRVRHRRPGRRHRPDRRHAAASPWPPTASASTWSPGGTGWRTRPRAHITNQRTIEVLRDLGVEEEATQAATPWELMGDTLFTTSLAGEEIARLRTWGTGDERHGDYLQGSPCPHARHPPALHGAGPGGRRRRPRRGVRFNTEYLAPRRRTTTASPSTVRDRLTGAASTRIRARYLVGADGARSQVVEELGLPLEGELARAGTVYILFHADLSRYVAHRPSILYWIMTPAPASARSAWACCARSGPGTSGSPAGATT